MKRSLVVLVLFFFLGLFVGAIFAQEPPAPPKKDDPPAPPKKDEQPAPPPAQQKKTLQEFYLAGEEKEDSFTYKEEPAFKIYKPGNKWHFVDLSKLQAAQLQNQKDQTKRQEIENFYRSCKCIMHNEDSDAIARVFVGKTNKTLADILKETEWNLQKTLGDFKLISRKSHTKCEAEGVSITYEGTPQGQKTIKSIIHIFSKNDCIYQLQIIVEKEKFDAGEKEFKKIYEKWKF